MSENSPHWLAREEVDALRLVSVYYGQTEFCCARTGSWYHCDETHTDLHGPYATRAEAEAACSRYARWLDDDGLEGE